MLMFMSRSFPLLSFPLLRYGRPVLARLIDIILPPRSPVTGDLVGVQGTISPEFWTELNFIQNPMCACCGLPFATPETPDTLCGLYLSDPPSFQIARSALYYDDAAAKLILPFKHGDRTLLAPLLAQWLLQAGKDHVSDTDYIIPVPLHRWRLLKRRYNQAGLLARALSRKTGIAWLPHTLQRRKATASQATKNAIQRQDNVRNAFSIPVEQKPLLKNKKVILIDDVHTTGATIKACCKTLRKAGVKEIVVLTLARVAKVI